MIYDDEKILSLIDENRVVSLLRDLIATDSQNPPGNENAVAVMIAGILREAGLEVTLKEIEPGRSNVIAFLPGRSEESLLLNGHLDTVKTGMLENWSCDPFGGEIRNGRIYGRGACDMKGGLAAMITALTAISKLDIKRERSILFTGVIDEEVFFKGTRDLIDSDMLKNCTACCIAEPTSCCIATSLQGAAEFTAVTYGKSAHCGMAEKGVNAIVPMADLVLALKNENDRLRDLYLEKGFDIAPTINTGVIKGGTDILLVPDRCELLFDRQVFPDENMDEAISDIRSLFDDTMAKHGATGELRLNQRFMPWEVDKSSPCVSAVIDAHRRACGSSPEETIFRGYAEIEMISAYGIPGVLYGPGSITEAHRPDEYVTVDELMKAARTYALIAYDFVTARP